MLSASPSTPHSSGATPPATVQLRASTAVHSASGSDFGTVVTVNGRELLLETASVLSVGEKLELKVNLEPIPGCALIGGVVVRQVEAQQSRRRAYVVMVGAISPVDKPGWERLIAYRSGQAPSTAPGASAAPPSGESANVGPNALSQAAVQREATRAALKAALHAPVMNSGTLKRRTREPEVIQRAPAAPAPARASAPAAASPQVAASPVAPAPAPRAAPAPRSGGSADLRWSSMSVGGRQYLEIAWQTPAAFIAAVRTQLAANVLTLPYDGDQAPPFAPPIVAVLRFGSLVVQTTAAPSQVEAHRVSYFLTLDGVQFAELRRAATASEWPK